MSTLRSHPFSLAQGAEPCASCGARQASICAALDDRDLRQLAALAVPMPIAAGAGFIAEGDPAEHFFNITSGTAKLFKLLPDGRRQITGFATTGTFLGLAVSATYSFGAEAVEPTRICRFSRHRLRHMLDAFPAMERRLLEVASNELVAAQEQMLLLGRKTARERVASFLIAWATPGASRGAAPGTTLPLAAAGEIHLPMARGDIADYLGLTVETVSRTFTRLRAEHLITTPTPSAVVFRDRAQLVAIAAGQA